MLYWTQSFLLFSNNPRKLDGIGHDTVYIVEIDIDENMQKCTVYIVEIDIAENIQKCKKITTK